MITPVNADFSIDRTSVASVMKTFTQNHISVFVLGTTGESTSVPEKQKTDLVKWAVLSKQNQSKVYAGISGNCLQESIDAANLYASMGVDAVVAHLPFYYPMSGDNMLKYFETLANNITCPLILYNNPITVKMSIPLEVIDKLSYHPGIYGVKDSERGIERLDKSIELWANRNDFSFLLGWAVQSAYGLIKGCDGIVPSTANLTPEIYKLLYDSAIQGNAEEAEKMQQLTNEISEIYQKDKNISESIPALKVLMSEFDLCKPHVFPPMYEPAEDEQIRLKKMIREKIKKTILQE